MLCIYWNIPQNDTRKLFRPVYEKIDLDCLANKFRFHPLGPPPSICQHALLPADFWDMWMAHSIKHVTLQVTFQTAPQASSITFTSSSQLAERGIFDVHVRVRSAEESLPELLTLTLKFYRGIKNATVLRDMWWVFFVNVLVDCAIIIKMMTDDCCLCGETFSGVNICVSFAGLLCLRRWNRLLPGSVVSRRCSAAAREWTPSLLSAGTRTNCSNNAVFHIIASTSFAPLGKFALK